MPKIATGKVQRRLVVQIVIEQEKSELAENESAFMGEKSVVEEPRRSLALPSSIILRTWFGVRQRL